MQLTIIAAIFTAIVGVAFAMQNNVPVTVNFLVWRFDSSLAMVLLLALACGAIAVALLTTPTTLRRQWQLGSQKRRIGELEETCATLRGRVAELESQVPADKRPAGERSYVGLKQLMAGADPGPGAEDR